MPLISNCPICSHPDRVAIDGTLRRVGRGESYEGIKNRYEVSVARMRRHRKEGHAGGILSKLQGAE